MESVSIDEQNEFWRDFDDAIRTMFEGEGVICSPSQPIKQKRTNQLHELIGKVSSSLFDGEGKPTAKSVWAEMKKNHEEYDDECIIQDFTDEEILWKSKNGNEQKLHRNSFAPVLSKTKKNYH